MTKDVPDYACVVGSRARISGWVCECGVKLSWKKERGLCVRPPLHKEDDGIASLGSIGYCFTNRQLKFDALKVSTPDNVFSV